MVAVDYFQVAPGQGAGALFVSAGGKRQSAADSFPGQDDPGPGFSDQGNRGFPDPGIEDVTQAAGENKYPGPAGLKGRKINLGCVLDIRQGITPFRIDFIKKRLKNLPGFQPPFPVYQDFRGGKKRDRAAL